jgi:hypothetical protein
MCSTVSRGAGVGRKRRIDFRLVMASSTCMMTGR